MSVRRHSHRCRFSICCGGELLEERQLLAAVPFGATVEDTGEFMLGDVLVTVVLMESDGSRDESQENWTAAEISQVKSRVQEGMQWWTDTLAMQTSVHELNFHFDWTFADQPVATGYEPISRVSDDFSLWIDDFFAAANAPTGSDFSERIRAFNDRQRHDYQTNWAFTIFVVDASSDLDKRFANGGTFSQSFAYAGGRFFVTTSERPASSFAHETGHMFWAVDEYAGGKPYAARRGYYNSQNTNGMDGNPDPSLRVHSIMDSHEIAYASHSISTSAMEMIGWRDSDGNGIFDVLDVPLVLAGSGRYDSASGTYTFDGFAQVSTLANLNSSGTRHDITINRIDVIQIRYNGGSWTTVAAPLSYQSAVEFTVDVPGGTRQVDIRAADLKSGVVSNLLSETVNAQHPVWQNPANPWDVNNDTIVSPIDALLIINRLNVAGAGELSGISNGPPYLDSNGDGYLSAIDALLVINQLNAAPIDAALAVVPASGWNDIEPDAEFDVFIDIAPGMLAADEPPDGEKDALSWPASLDAALHVQRRNAFLACDSRYNEA